jgi:serine/threonine-protein kinase PknK
LDEPSSAATSVADDLVAELAAAGFADAEEIGRGGFAVVYRARQLALNRMVAIKVLTSELAESRPRLMREQKILGQLSGHPNIVTVFEVDETKSGTPFLVTPYCSGGSLQERIERDGVLGLDEVLRVGVKISGALETAHRVGVVHRDVKPANILLTDYDEPALCDFGIARTGVGFRTKAGVFTGSPAFTAPEILQGEPPGPASDVYGLGATLFVALTGHAAFERRSGEQLVAQFVRITNETMPNLREHDIPDRVATLIELAMSRRCADRPSALELGELIQQVQANDGLAVDEMALNRVGSVQRRPDASRNAPAGSRSGRLSAAPIGLVGRGDELAQLCTLVDASPLVTLTGVGGVGKTTLAIRAANDMREQFHGGVWVVELAALRDGSLLAEVTAATVGIQDQAGRTITDILVSFLAPRHALLVLDNCEHIIDDAAKLVEILLRECARLHILATSREVLCASGEAVLALPPLGFPSPDEKVRVRSLGGYDAVALFVQRARAAVPAFSLTEHNAAAVARICSGLDGLPLAIELAAARLRALSVEQIAQGLSDRYALLRRGRRSAPERQQSLDRCIEWSYNLCTRAEQQLWQRLTVFAGSFDLPAAMGVCAVDQLTAEHSTEATLDAFCALVDKSILIRTEHAGVVRFRLLETLREFGKRLISDSEHYQFLRRCHGDWYRQLAADGAAEWFSDQQLYWLERILSEMPNLREAIEFSLSDAPATALRIAVRLREVWSTRGMITEARHWLDRGLAAIPNEPTIDRFRALRESALMATVSGDASTARSRAAEARDVLEQIDHQPATGLLDIIDAMVSYLSGDLTGACECCERAIAISGDDDQAPVGALVFVSWVLNSLGDSDGAMKRLERARVFTESRGESVWRSKVLTALGFTLWRQGEVQRAAEALEEGLQLSSITKNLQTVPTCLEGLAWIAGHQQNARRAVVLMAAAAVLRRDVGDPFLQLHAGDLAKFHEQCEQHTRDQLDAAEFDAAWHQGSELTFDQAVAFALAAASSTS